jgi:hypothetical protein
MVVDDEKNDKKNGRRLQATAASEAVVGGALTVCTCSPAASSEYQAFRGLRGREASLELAFML